MSDDNKSRNSKAESSSTEKVKSSSMGDETTKEEDTCHLKETLSGIDEALKTISELKEKLEKSSTAIEKILNTNDTVVKDLLQLEQENGKLNREMQKEKEIAQATIGKVRWPFLDKRNVAHTQLRKNNDLQFVNKDFRNKFESMTNELTQEKKRGLNVLERRTQISQLSNKFEHSIGEMFDSNSTKPKFQEDVDLIDKLKLENKEHITTIEKLKQDIYDLNQTIKNRTETMKYEISELRQQILELENKKCEYLDHRSSSEKELIEMKEKEIKEQMKIKQLKENQKPELEYQRNSEMLKSLSLFLKKQ